jgi:hypothetical protein
MSRKDHELTPRAEQDVLSYLRAGGFLHVAVEAVGLSAEAFALWLRRGEGRRAPARYRALARSVRQAQAQARLGAEASVLGDRPLDWLRYGPGREDAGRPGWTAAARPASAGAVGVSPLLVPEVEALLRAVVRRLEPFPEARAAVAGVLAGQRRGRGA